VFYKQKQNIELLYGSIAAQSFRDFTVYFVDNNTDEGDRHASEEANKRFGLDIIYLKSNGNAGFAGGNNLGARRAIDDGCNCIFFLNNDTELHPNCLEELMKTANSSPKIGVVAPIIYYGTSAEPKITIQEYGANANFRSYKISKNFEGQKLHMAKESLGHSLEVDLVSGGACLVKTEVLKKTGLWEESYFAYGDEIDLARRIRAEHYKTFVISRAELWHNHKWEKANKDGYYFEYYLIQRNKYLYFRKYKLYIPLLVSLFVDEIKFPWRLIWFMKVCDFKLGMCYLRGTIAGVLGHKGAPPMVKAPMEKN
jgi:GT2 family glycosyltransferase